MIKKLRLKKQQQNKQIISKINTYKNFKKDKKY